MTEEAKSQSWWQTLPGIMTALTGLITAVAGLIIALAQAGVFDRSKDVSPSPDDQEAVASPSIESPDLESQLKAANIILSTGTEKDLTRVRGYVDEPKSAYWLLAHGCLQLFDDNQLKSTGHLDMIDKWYTALVGEENYASADGKLNTEKLKEAIVKANNEIYGEEAESFEQLVVER